jgi:hypothetical protein
MLLQSTAGDIALLSQPLEFLEIFVCSYPTSLILIVGFQRTPSRFELQPQRIAGFAQHRFLGYAPGGEPEEHLPRSWLVARTAAPGRLLRGVAGH